MKAKELKENYGLSELEIQKVVCLKQLLGDDIDGAYSMLQDEGIYIEFEDLNLLEIRE